MRKSASVLAAMLALGASAVQAAEPAPAKSVIKSAPFVMPDPATIPGGPMGEAIRYGEKIATQTQVYAKAYVGNGLNCTSCHLDGGKKQGAATWVGIWGVFPEYRSRNARINSLQDRINDCFQRSMNGKPLPLESKEMQGMLAYMWWLSKDVPTGMDVQGRGFRRLQAVASVDPVRGKTLFAEKCVACHQADGSGMTKPDGSYLFPAVWGPKSFNIGAGLGRLNNAASFIKHNMPQGQEGTLSDQDAYDIAEYVIKQPRPDFAHKQLDWPKGDKPKDARY